MTPRFAQAVDPIMLHVLERISHDERLSPQDERSQLRAWIDRAEAVVGATPDWELAKYALAAWIDEVLVDTAWDGAEWWSNNPVEVELFQTRLCNEQFYLRAQQASTLPSRDALEVFYVCVVLGFRGLYRDASMAAMFTAAHNLPVDLETWARQTALAIDDFDMCLAWYLAQPIDPTPFARFDHTGDAGPIDLAHRAIFKLFAEPTTSTDMTRDDESTGNRAIESMRHAEIDVARLLLAVTQPLFDLHLGAIDARRRLRRQACGFVEDKARTRFVEQARSVGHAWFLRWP